jgi:hypothetical protein
MFSEPGSLKVSFRAKPLTNKRGFARKETDCRARTILSSCSAGDIPEIISFPELLLSRQLAHPGCPGVQLGYGYSQGQVMTKFMLQLFI